jgi:hypothetical protein
MRQLCTSDQLQALLPRGRFVHAQVLGRNMRFRTESSALYLFAGRHPVGPAACTTETLALLGLMVELMLAELMLIDGVNPSDRATTHGYP